MAKIAGAWQRSVSDAYFVDLEKTFDRVPRDKLGGQLSFSLFTQIESTNTVKLMSAPNWKLQNQSSAIR